MLNSAKQVNLPVSGYYGGILHDEAKIQEDLVIKVKGGTNELIGWVDEGDNLRILKEQNVTKKLANFLQEFPVQYQPNTCSHVLFLILISCVFSSPRIPTSSSRR
jgi:hypothetical protein